MTKAIVSLTAGLTLALAGAMIGGRAQAAVIVPDGLRIAADQVAAVDTVQFMFRGRRYCWYPAGWRGPGWYRCGFRWRRGLGWGGPGGWHGWRVPGHHRQGRSSAAQSAGNPSADRSSAGCEQAGRSSARI